MMEHFLEKYGATIKKYGHQMQSLDYHVIDKVLTYDSEIPVYFILPYNSIFPRTKATGYTMEYSTLDEYFVNKLWTTDQRLYVWTVNGSEAFDKAVRLGADGMITDDLEMVQSQVTMAQDDPEYTELLLKKAMEFLISKKKRETVVSLFCGLERQFSSESTEFLLSRFINLFKSSVNRLSSHI